MENFNNKTGQITLLTAHLAPGKVLELSEIRGKLQKRTSSKCFFASITCKKKRQFLSYLQTVSSQTFFNDSPGEDREKKNHTLTLEWKN